MITVTTIEDRIWGGYHFVAGYYTSSLRYATEAEALDAGEKWREWAEKQHEDSLKGCKGGERNG